MLIALAALALMATVIFINDDDTETNNDEDTLIPDEELVDENGLTPLGGGI
ncbi:MAG: hypothetical protein JKY94_05080 [Rhodobacteraceae bacterium]|nr:hypothetical protein [Paracoccaceae bacterium]